MEQETQSLIEALENLALSLATVLCVSFCDSTQRIQQKPMEFAEKTQLVEIARLLTCIRESGEQQQILEDLQQTLETLVQEVTFAPKSKSRSQI